MTLRRFSNVASSNAAMAPRTSPFAIPSTSAPSIDRIAAAKQERDDDADREEQEHAKPVGGEPR